MIKKEIQSEPMVLPRKAPKPNSHQLSNCVTVTINLKQTHAAFLEALAAQWGTGVPNVIETIISRVFPKDHNKITKLFSALHVLGMEYPEIVYYLKSGERSPVRISWLRSQKQKQEEEKVKK